MKAKREKRGDVLFVRVAVHGNEARAKAVVELAVGGHDRSARVWWSMDKIERGTHDIMAGVSSKTCVSQTRTWCSARASER